MITNKEIVPEQEYRYRIRVMARIMDHQDQLISMGWEDDLSFLQKKDVLKYSSTHDRLVKIFDKFQQKPNGYEAELLQIYSKFDDLLKKCRNEKERKAIGVMGVLEINKLFDKGRVGKGGELSIDKQTVLSESVKEGK